MWEKLKRMNLSSLGPLGWISTLCWLQLEVLKPRRGVFGTTNITKMGLNWWKGCCDVNNHQALQELSAATSIISTVVVKLHSNVHIKQKHCTIAHMVSLVAVPTLCLISTCNMERWKASERSVVFTYIATECKLPSQHDGSIPVSFALQYQHKLHTFAWRPVQAPCSCITSSSSTT
jgi:hypothetical protein